MSALLNRVHSLAVLISDDARSSEDQMRGVITVTAAGHTLTLDTERAWGMTDDELSMRLVAMFDPKTARLLAEADAS